MYDYVVFVKQSSKTSQLNLRITSTGRQAQFVVLGKHDDYTFLLLCLTEWFDFCCGHCLTFYYYYYYYLGTTFYLIYSYECLYFCLPMFEWIRILNVCIYHVFVSFFKRLLGFLMVFIVTCIIISSEIIFFFLVFYILLQSFLLFFMYFLHFTIFFNILFMYFYVFFAFDNR